MTLIITLAFHPPARSEETTSTSPAVATAVAKQQIEYLRRDYAKATDLIGRNTPESIAQGRAIYRRIFTPDAEIVVTVDGEAIHGGKGPEEWLRVVRGALQEFEATQHLIGTQLVEIHSLPPDGEGGAASMTSYLQAWHAYPDERIDLFIGTYHDKVRYTKGVGWQIHHMNLERVSGKDPGSRW